MSNPMLNSTLMQMMNIVRNGGNPMQIFQQMAGQNPRVALAMRMIQGKNPQQLRSMAENMCHERGTTIEQVAQQLGLQIPNTNK